MSMEQDYESWRKQEVSLPPHGSPERAKLEDLIPTLVSLRKLGGPVTPARYHSLVYGDPWHKPTAEEWSNTPELFQYPGAIPEEE